MSETPDNSKEFYRRQFKIQLAEVEKLEAELTKERDYSAETHARFEKQNERIAELQAEIARLHEKYDLQLLVKSNAEKDREIERLRFELDHEIEKLATCVEALEKIATVGVRDGRVSVAFLKGLATEALARIKGEV